MKYFALLLLIVVSTPAFAGDYLFEPYFGYYNGEFKAGSASAPEVSGWGYGARAAIIYHDMQIGLDYMTGSMKNDASPQASVTPDKLGFFLGYKFPANLRLYGEYFFQDKYKTKTSGSTHTLEGEEIRLGIGLTFMPYVDVNVEYSFGDLDTDNGSSMNNPYKVRFVGINASIPLEF